jgi:hypothetical protein
MSCAYWKNASGNRFSMIHVDDFNPRGVVGETQHGK